MASWNDLEQQGWVRRETITNNRKRVTYLRPDGRVVSQKTHLSDTEQREIHHILFPGNKKRRVSVTINAEGQISQEANQGNTQVNINVFLYIMSHKKL